MAVRPGSALGGSIGGSEGRRPVAEEDPIRSWSPFTDRNRELAELLSALGSTSHGRGGVYFLTGEPGIGKSRLATEFAERAAEGGARVLWGRAWEGQGAPALWPWMQILRAYARSRDVDALRTEVGEGGRYLARLVPEVAEAFDEVGEPLGSETSHLHLFEAVRDILRRVADSGPLVLILEDLHWTDPSSLSLLAFLADEVRSLPLFVLGTYRESDLEARRDLAEVVPLLLRRGERIALGGLPPDAVEHLLEALGLGELPDRTASVTETTGGNPLFVREYARLLLTAGEGWTHASGVPAGIRSTIRARLAHLSPEAQELLEAASVAGRDFSLRVVAGAVGLEPERAAELLDEGRTWRIVRALASPTDIYAFSHALVREALYEELGSVRRATLHARVGEALERHYARSSSQHASELAVHFTAAAMVVGHEKALGYEVRAAEEAAEHLAYEAAAGHYRRSLGLLEGRPGQEEGRARALIGLGRMLWRSGHTPGSTAALLEGATVARRHGWARLAGEAALAVGGGHGLDPMNVHELMGLMEEALDGLEPDEPLRVRLLARLGNSYTSFGLSSERIERGKAYTAEALDRAERSGDPALVAYAMYMREFALGDPLHDEERSVLDERYVELAEGHGGLEDRVRAHGFCTFDRIREGDLVRAWAEYQVTLGLVRRLGQSVYAAMAAMIPAVLAHAGGRLARARRALERAYEEAHDIDDWIVTSQLRILSGELARAVGDTEGVERFAEQLEDELTLHGQAVRMRLLLWLGRRDEARELFEGLFAGRESWQGAFWTGYVLGLLAETCAEFEDARRAEVLYELLGPYEGRLLTANWPPLPLLGDAATFLGPLASLLGRHADAERHLEGALRHHETIGSPTLAVRARLALARVLAGREGAEARAAEVWEEAQEDAEAMGMRGLPPALCPFGGGRRPSVERGGRGARPAHAELRRDGEMWAAGFAGETVRIRPSKGLCYLRHLLASPGREIHVVDLVGLVDGEPSSRRGSSVATQDGLRPGREDAGSLLDAEAKAAYRRRLTELRDEMEEAELFEDSGRATRAKVEMDRITEELSRSVGLGGRDRRAASAAERARVNVTRTIRYAIRKISRELPGLGKHLENAVRTGTFCSYDPDPRTAPEWRL